MTPAVAAVIPARYASTRLPGKPLLRDTGRCLIQHVHDRVRAARHIARVIVATDDARIAQAVRAFGGEVRMTAPEHESGTDRIAEVARDIDAAAFINVQGDEPEIDPAELDRLAQAILEPGAEIATLATPITAAATFADQNAVKVVLDARGRALYFSRAPIPAGAPDATAVIAHKHLGVYAYTRAALFRFTSLPPAALERRERLEQLRALFHGMSIHVLISAHDSIGVDTAEDYRRFVERWRTASMEAP